MKIFADRRISGYIIKKISSPDIPEMNKVKEQEMTEKKQETKKKEKNWPLPYCTSAPSAEHHRGEDKDEPCDDARATNFEEGPE